MKYRHAHWHILTAGEILRHTQACSDTYSTWGREHWLQYNGSIGYFSCFLNSYKLDCHEFCCVHDPQRMVSNHMYYSLLSLLAPPSGQTFSLTSSEVCGSACEVGCCFFLRRFTRKQRTKSFAKCVLDPSRFLTQRLPTLLACDPLK